MMLLLFRLLLVVHSGWASHRVDFLGKSVVKVHDVIKVVIMIVTSVTFLGFFGALLGLSPWREDLLDLTLDRRSNLEVILKGSSEYYLKLIVLSNVFHLRLSRYGTVPFICVRLQPAS